MDSKDNKKGIIFDAVEKSKNYYYTNLCQEMLNSQNWQSNVKKYNDIRFSEIFKQNWFLQYSYFGNNNYSNTYSYLVYDQVDRLISGLGEDADSIFQAYNLSTKKDRNYDLKKKIIDNLDPIRVVPALRSKLVAYLNAIDVDFEVISIGDKAVKEENYNYNKMMVKIAINDILTEIGMAQQFNDILGDFGIEPTEPKTVSELQEFLINGSFKSSLAIDIEDYINDYLRNKLDFDSIFEKMKLQFVDYGLAGYFVEREDDDIKIHYDHRRAIIPLSTNDDFSDVPFMGYVLNDTFEGLYKKLKKTEEYKNLSAKEYQEMIMNIQTENNNIESWITGYNNNLKGTSIATNKIYFVRFQWKDTDLVSSDGVVKKNGKYEVTESYFEDNIKQCDYYPALQLACNYKILRKGKNAKFDGCYSAVNYKNGYYNSLMYNVSSLVKRFQDCYKKFNECIDEYVPYIMSINSDSIDRNLYTKSKNNNIDGEPVQLSVQDYQKITLQTKTVITSNVNTALGEQVKTLPFQFLPGTPPDALNFFNTALSIYNQLIEMVTGLNAITSGNQVKTHQTDDAVQSQLRSTQQSLYTIETLIYQNQKNLFSILLQNVFEMVKDKNYNNGSNYIPRSHNIRIYRNILGQNVKHKVDIIPENISLIDEYGLLVTPVNRQEKEVEINNIIIESYKTQQLTSADLIELSNIKNIHIKINTAKRMIRNNIKMAQQQQIEIAQQAEIEKRNTELAKKEAEIQNKEADLEKEDKITDREIDKEVIRQNNENYRAELKLQETEKKTENKNKNKN